jgi:hypothetical protein
VKLKQTCTTVLVEEALREALLRYDFLNYAMLVKKTGRSINQVSAACHHLRKYGAIDVVIDNGVAWWQALEEDKDRRSFKKVELTPESKPRKRRKTKCKPVKEFSNYG